MKKYVNSDQYSEVCKILYSDSMDEIMKSIPKDKAKLLDSIINKIKEVVGNEEDNEEDEDEEENSETESNAKDSKSGKRTLDEPFSTRVKLKDKEMEGYIISLSKMKKIKE